jgi:hypothetical protein
MRKPRVRARGFLLWRRLEAASQAVALARDKLLDALNGCVNAAAIFDRVRDHSTQG